MRVDRTNLTGIAIAAAYVVIVGVASTASAQTAAEFYKGRELRLLVSHPAGGGYDTYARFYGRHLGRLMPGNPNVVVQNMPGAAGIAMTNYLFHQAPKDGSVIGLGAGPLATAALDNTVFVLGLRAGLAVAGAQVAARMASVLFHYPLARGVVFQSTWSHLATLPLYLGLVAVSGTASYHLLGMLREHFGWTVLGAKLAAETGLLLVNFWIQRDLIFRDGRRG